jgi:hypothetical protein
MPLACEPPQPEPIVAAIERLSADGAPDVDPWWGAGLVDSLRSWDGAPPQEAWGGSGVVEP